MYMCVCFYIVNMCINVDSYVVICVSVKQYRRSECVCVGFKCLVHVSVENVSA